MFLPYKRDGSGVIVGKRVQLLAADADSGRVRTLAAGDCDVNVARWSPDGQHLASTRGRGGRQRRWKDLWIANAEGRHARQRTHTLASVQKLAWSPAGMRVALIAAEREGGARARVWILDVEGKTPPRLLGGEDLELATASGIVGHPAGRRIAVVAMHRGLQPLVVAGVERDGVAILRHGLRQAYAVAPCGERLAYVSTSMRWPDELYSVDWPGGNVRRHTRFNRHWAGDRPQPRVRKRRLRSGRPQRRRTHRRLDAAAVARQATVSPARGPRWWSAKRDAHDLRTDTPTLILQGADDGRCPIGQSEALFARLIRSTGVPAELVVYPGAGHGFAESGKPGHRVDYHQRLSDWANRWTLGQAACGPGDAGGGTAQAA